MKIITIMQKWHLIQQQPLFSEIFQDPLIVSYKRGRSLKMTYSFEPNSKLAKTPGWELCSAVTPILITVISFCESVDQPLEPKSFCFAFFSFLSPSKTTTTHKQATQAMQCYDDALLEVILPR